MTITIPTGGTVVLLDRGGTPTGTTTYTEYSGSGLYTLDPATGVFSYDPAYGTQGAVNYPAGYQITDAYGQSASGTYTPTVAAPPGPTPPALTSTGPENQPQTADVTLPPPSETGGVTLLDATNQRASSVTVLGGVYTMNRSTGVITFTPTTGYSGTPTPVTYRVTDGYGTPGSNTYTPTVVPAPTPPPLTSTGIGTAPQSAQAVVPTGESVTLMDGSTPVTTLTVPGQGTYALNTGTGVITFTPNYGFSGTATPVTYRVTATDGQSGTSTYTPTVTAPAGPTAGPLASTGVGTAPQSATATIPSGGSVTLLDGSTPVSTLTITGQGTYSIDPGTGVITFTPILGYTGTASPATYRLSDAYGTTSPSTYTPTVTPPPGPTATPLTSTGVVTTPQAVAVAIPPGGSVTLMDGSTPTTSLTVPGEGTYSLDAVSGVITFSPIVGYAGTASPVTYRVIDAYGQGNDSTYSALVLAGAPAPRAPAPAPRASTPLPRTGADVAGLAPAGLLLIIAGAAATGLARRRGLWITNRRHSRRS